MSPPVPYVPGGFSALIADSPRGEQAEFEAAIHYSSDGWIVIPAPAFRCAMIDACRLVGAKISVFIEADGFDADDGTPLVRLMGWGTFTLAG